MAKRFVLAPVLTGTLAERYPELSENQAKFAASVAARAELYSGNGRAEFFKGQEIDSADGYIFDYQSRDGAGTCTPCLVAEENGPYLSGQGPYPGSVCRGGGRCRCTRTPRWAPEEAARLRGE